MNRYDALSVPSSSPLAEPPNAKNQRRTFERDGYNRCVFGWLKGGFYSETSSRFCSAFVDWVPAHATRKEPRIDHIRAGKLIRFTPQQVEEFVATGCCPRTECQPFDQNETAAVGVGWNSMKTTSSQTWKARWANWAEARVDRRGRARPKQRSIVLGYKTKADLPTKAAAQANGTPCARTSCVRGRADRRNGLLLISSGSAMFRSVARCGLGARRHARNSTS